MKAICESGWIKKQLKSLLLKEKEDFILDYDTDAHLYNKERVMRYGGIVERMGLIGVVIYLVWRTT